MRNPPAKYLAEPCPHCGHVGIVNPKWLRATREAAGVGLRALARSAKLTAGYLSRIERGTKAPLPHIVTIYERLGP